MIFLSFRVAVPEVSNSKINFKHHKFKSIFKLPPLAAVIDGKLVSMIKQSDHILKVIPKGIQ